jgi:hypothetical protein
MAHLNLYLPDIIGKKLDLEAKNRRRSLSKLVLELIERALPMTSEWQAGFFTDVVGQWQGEFPLIERDKAEERPGL